MKTWTLAALVAVLLAVPAVAQSPAKPDPGCNPVYADKKGDVEFENLDITGFWFSHAGGKTTANMRIANLTQDLPPESTGMNWYVLWNFDDAQRFVSAQVEAPNLLGPDFSYGTVNGNIRDTEASTEGQFIEGPDGVISMEIPADIGGTKGVELKGVLADTQRALGVPMVASALFAVDEASGKTFKVEECSAATAPETPAGPGSPPSTTPGPDEPPSGQQRELDVDVAKKVPRAKKVRRSLKLRLSSQSGVENIVAGLHRGKSSSGKQVGSGKLSKLERKGTLKLRIKGKKFKKGIYTLVLSGTNADGSSGQRAFRLKFK